jgi:signal transduction histidine kinase/ActR/RegA family two-component response regulator
VRLAKITEDEALLDECLSSALANWPQDSTIDPPPQELVARQVTELLQLARDLATTTFPDSPAPGDQPLTTQELTAREAACRAVRGCVLRRWSASDEVTDRSDLDDLVRFDEAIDQWLATSVRRYADRTEQQLAELRASEEQARRDARTASHAQETFLATLSHEMRTPLNAILGWVEMLRMKEHLDAELTEGLEVIDRNARGQIKLVEELLDISSIMGGKLRLKRAECDLVEAVAEGVESLRPVANLRDIRLDVDLDAEARRVVADPARVRQIVTNLVSNALKFTPVRGKVRITLVRDSGMAKLTVTDNGQGISPEQLPYLFDWFWQAEVGARRSDVGLGLGLSIVKHLVEEHGGTVEVFSAGEGKGSTFVVSLPTAEREPSQPLPENSYLDLTDAATREESAEAEVARLDGVRVLVIDDDPHTRTICLRLLKRFGAKVTSAGSVAEALAGLTLATRNGEAPDVLVSDIGMPDLDGYELIREVRRRGYDATHLPAIALTAYTSPRDIQEAAQAGFQLHLKKPVAIGELAAAIAGLAARGAEV